MNPYYGIIWIRNQWRKITDEFQPLTCMAINMLPSPDYRSCGPVLYNILAQCSPIFMVQNSTLKSAFPPFGALTENISMVIMLKPFPFILKLEQKCKCFWRLKSESPFHRNKGETMPPHCKVQPCRHILPAPGTWVWKHLGALNRSN